MKKNEFPDEKEETGEFDDPYELYKWKYTIRPVDLPAPNLGNEGSMQNMVGKQLTKEISPSIRELKITVSWDEGGQEEVVDLVTHWVKL